MIREALTSGQRRLPRHRAVWLGCVLSSALPGVAAAQLALPSLQQPAECETVSLAAESATCDAARCLLDGEATLGCGDLTLRADQLEVELQEDGGFAGAVASGHALLVQRGTVVTCARISLDQDRVRGRIDAATIRMKRDPKAVDARGVPSGKDAAVFHGDLERLEDERLVIYDADFTMCDCGEEPPSWRLDAASIDADLDDRAVLWWPQLVINPLGLGLVPITPPLPPISIPLRRRAMGFLPPEIAFMKGSAWPMIDLPFFVPLGESWDVTITPGMRLDWGRHRITPPSTWGAPRLGGRLRYAPDGAASGELLAQWTWDRKHQAARLYVEQNPAATEPEVERRQRLEHRVELGWRHRTDFTDRAQWLVDAQWVSDDLIPPDFRIGLTEQAPSYLPSRTQLLWRAPGLTGLAAADYLLLTRNAADGYSNIRGAERATLHRGPHASLRLSPVHLAGGVHVDARVSGVRYGPWVPDLPATLVLGEATAGVSYMGRVGPVELSARGGVEALWLDPVHGDARAVFAALTEAAGSVRLARSFGDLVHVVSPRLEYRGVSWTSNEVPELAPVDPFLALAPLQQAMVSLDQGLWLQGAAPRQLGRLVLGQPFDLRTGEPLATRARLEWVLGRMGTASLWADLDPRRRASFEEVGGRVSVRAGPLSVTGEYARWTPRAERFRRTVYELAASGAPVHDKSWLHSASGSVALRLENRVVLSYSTDYLLPVPVADRDTGFSDHRVSASYHSPCDCWDLGISATAPAQDPWGRLSIGFTLSVGGFSLGG